MFILEQKHYNKFKDCRKTKQSYSNNTIEVVAQAELTYMTDEVLRYTETQYGSHSLPKALFGCVRVTIVDS